MPFTKQFVEVCTRVEAWYVKAQTLLLQAPSMDGLSASCLPIGRAGKHVTSSVWRRTGADRLFATTEAGYMGFIPERSE